MLFRSTAIGLAQAASGSFTEVANAGLEAMQNFQTYTKESVEAAKAATESQKATQDKLTEGVMGSAVAADKLRVALQEELTPAITTFAKYTKEILESVSKQVKEMTGKDEKSWLQKHARDIAKWGGAAVGGTIGAIGTAWSEIGRAHV